MGKRDSDSDSDRDREREGGGETERESRRWGLPAGHAEAALRAMEEAAGAGAAGRVPLLDFAGWAVSVRRAPPGDADADPAAVRAGGSGRTRMVTRVS